MSEIIINGKWFLPGSNKKVGGILKIDTKLDENLILELSDILEMTDQDLKTIFNNKIKHINLILGETTNGDKITLINSIILQRESRGILKPEIIKQIFDVQMIINDIHLENIDYKFTSFRFQTKNLANITGYRLANPKMENDIFSNIELPKENLEEELLETDDFKIKLKILTNYKNLSYFLENGKKTIILEEKTYLQVNFKLPKTINEIINFADRISKFLSLSTLEFEQITELQLITEDENRALINKANVKIFDKEKDYNESELRGLVWCELSTPRIGKDIKENQKFGKRTLAYTFYFSHNKNFFKEGLKNWLENYDNNIILINVFFSVYFHATLFIENKIKDYVAIIERYGKKVLKVEPVFENYISNENFKSISEKIDTIINKEVSNKELLISLKKNIEKSNKKKTKTNDFELTCRKIFEDESLKKLLKTFNLEIDEKLFTDISSYRNTATHLKEDFESLSKENKEFSYTCLLEYIIFTQFFLFTDPEKKCINKILYSYDKNRVNLRIHYLLYLMKINTLEENKK